MIQTQVLREGPPRLTGWGSARAPALSLTSEKISAGLAQRLAGYALRLLAESGFAEVVPTWNRVVYTMDANEKPSERSYNVKYTNLAGGYIEVTGILTHNGWPHVAHGLAIGMD